MRACVWLLSGGEEEKKNEAARNNIRGADGGVGMQMAERQSIRETTMTLR